MTDDITTPDDAAETTKDPANAVARAAGGSIAKSLYLAGVIVPKLPEEGGEAVDKSTLSKEDFAEKRKDYQKVAKQILKKLQKQGFTLAKAEGVEDDDDEE